MSTALERIRAYADPALCLHLPQTADEGVAVPFAVKDNIDVVGMPTTAGCPTFSYMPAADAHVVARLRAAGNVPVAKVALDQFATGLVGTRAPAGIPRNPFDPLRIPGGSSSGSACAVAAGLVPFALGTDTAGSGRVPAALQNLVGFKPTKGWLSTRGVVPAVRSLDCVSVFALTVEKAWQVTCTAAGFDAADIFSRQRPDGVDSHASAASPGLRLGVPAAEQLDGSVEPGLLGRYRAMLAHLTALGHELVAIDYSPFLAAGRLLYEGPWVAERTAALGDFLATQPPDADPIVAGIIRAGRVHDAVAAWRGTYELARLRRLADVEWERMDVLVLPTVCAYPTLEEVRAEPLAVNSRLGRFTNFANLLDTCAVAVPAGFSAGLPAGITLFAPAWHDGVIARLAATLHDRLIRCEGVTLGALGTTLTRAQHIPLNFTPDFQEKKNAIIIAVFGAHLQGQPLNPQMQAWGGRFVAACRTTADYRMFLLPASPELPARPGLVRVADAGASITGELWSMPAAGFGRLVASIAAPLGVGTVTCLDLGPVKGFICEAVGVVGVAVDITDYGDWRGFLGARLGARTDPTGRSRAGA